MIAYPIIYNNNNMDQQSGQGLGLSDLNVSVINFKLPAASFLPISLIKIILV
jgi:hypothetical protein